MRGLFGSCWLLWGSGCNDDNADDDVDEDDVDGDNGNGTTLLRNVRIIWVLVVTVGHNGSGDNDEGCD